MHNTSRPAGSLTGCSMSKRCSHTSSPAGLGHLCLRLGRGQLLDHLLAVGSGVHQKGARLLNHMPAAGGLASGVPAVMFVQQPWQVYFAEISAAAAAVLAFHAYEQRPRGWTKAGLVQCRRSPVAGYGVFACAPIQKGTVLGCYPGRPRSAQEMYEKCLNVPNARQYAFQTSDGRYLDPTDDIEGLPHPHPPGPAWPAAVDITMAYANEPTTGGRGTNVFIEDGVDSLDLLFVANRDIREGEEVFIDYGTTYDRSGYTG